MRLGSLCTGYGGLDMAVRAVLGGELAWLAENERNAATVAEARHEGVPNLGDLTAVDWEQVAPVDVLTAGYPCQPFSHAGQRRGTDDERHLWPFIAEAVATLRPGLVFFENVAGHLSLGFNEVLADLDELGYEVEWTVVRASDVGACHRRARLFICGKDRYGRGVRGGDHRRRGMHLHPEVGEAVAADVRSPGGRGDGRQGATAPAGDGGDLRGSDSQAPGRDGAMVGGVGVVAVRAGGEGIPRAGAASPAAEAAPSGGGDPIPDGRGLSRAGEQEMAELAARRGVAGPHADEGAERSGSEPAGGTVRDPAAELMDEPAGVALRRGVVLGADHDAAIRLVAVGDAVRASDVGACHRRERLFVVAYPRGERHGGGQDRRVVGRVGTTTEGGGREEGGPRTKPGDRSATAPADATHVGRERVGGPRRGWSGPADGRRPAVADADRGGLEVGSQLDGEQAQAAPDRHPRWRHADGPRHETEWGPYEPAIRRHEAAVGRPAPAPTDDKGRLSARFVEWMMMLPAGWVTDLLPRNPALKALGNGVVPPQAEHALRLLLARIELERAA